MKSPKCVGLCSGGLVVNSPAPAQPGTRTHLRSAEKNQHPLMQADDLQMKNTLVYFFHYIWHGKRKEKRAGGAAEE
jgi:hypothetical protein